MTRWGYANLGIPDPTDDPSPYICEVCTAKSVPPLPIYFEPPAWFHCPRCNRHGFASAKAPICTDCFAHALLSMPIASTTITASGPTLIETNLNILAATLALYALILQFHSEVELIRVGSRYIGGLCLLRLVYWVARALWRS